MPLKKVSFTLSIDAPQLFAALTQMGAEVEVGFNGEPPRGKGHRAPKQLNGPAPLMITDQSKKVKTSDLALSFLKTQNEPVTSRVVKDAVQRVDASKTDGAVYQALIVLCTKKQITKNKDGLYAVARGVK